MDRQTIEVSASVPRLRELLCMVGKVNLTETGDPSMRSRYHWPIFRCRLMINSLPEEVIASPKNFGDRYIYVVTTRDLFKTGKVQSVLLDLNIQCCGFVEVTQKVYEDCLKYTLACNVAPMWNKVSDYLLQGKDFLTSSNRPMKAVQLDALVTDEATRFLVSPTIVRLPRLTLEYFSLSATVIENFTTNETGSIEFNNPETQSWVYVLPSLRKGRVVSISKRIPQPSPFENYQQLKKHWKNMYGYRLPESEADLIYYRVNFSWTGQACFTYPNHCLSPAKLEQFRLDDAKNTAEQFLRDLTERTPKICGTTLKLKELRTCTSTDQFQEDDQKENIPNNQSRIAKRFDEIWNLRAKPSCSSQLATSSDNSEQKSCLKLLTERNRNTKTVRSPQPVKSQVDKTLAGSPRDENKTENDQESFSLLRSRSSFEFDEFSKALQNEDLLDQIMGGNLTARPEISESDEGELDSPAANGGTVEIKSRFFNDFRNESHGHVKLNSRGDPLEEEKESNESNSLSSRVKLHCLPTKQLPSSREPMVNLKGNDRLSVTSFQTKDISSYFTHKKQVKMSTKPDVVKSCAAKSVQPQLDGKRIAEEEEKESIENKKKKLADDNQAIC